MASMAHFYFDFRDADKQKLCNVLPSLLVQLSARSDACCDKLSQLYSAHDLGVQKPSDLAMAECLKQMLALAERPVSLHDESGQKEDIANYVSSSVHTDRRMGRWREEDKELVIKTLSEKADGM